MITRIHPIKADWPTARVLTLTLQDESVVLGEDATVRVEVNEEPVAIVTAKVVKQQGADGGYYPAVRLEFKEIRDGTE